MNRYGSIMERITAQQEAEDREDGDAIRRECANEQREKRVKEQMFRIIDSLGESYIEYLEDYLNSKYLMDEFMAWMLERVHEDFED